MATTQRPTKADQPTRDRTPLQKGFDYLTLDPSPRLRKMREDRRQRDPFAEAWKSVGEAIAEAIRIVAKKVKSSTR
jgi:hypothetical protein